MDESSNSDLLFSTIYDFNSLIYSHSIKLHNRFIYPVTDLIAEFYLVDRGLRHRLPGFPSMGRLVILP